MSGEQKLWGWFGLSYATWLTLPRVLMHEMPDEWQSKMADLLEEWDETWNGADMPTPNVTARDDRTRRFVKWPAWLLNYRHPMKNEIDKVRNKKSPPLPPAPPPERLIKEGIGVISPKDE